MTFKDAIRPIHRSFLQVNIYRRIYRGTLTVRWFAKSLCVFTFQSAIRWLLLRLEFERYRQDGLIELRFRRYDLGIFVRPGTSDALVIEQVFLKEEYRGACHPNSQLVVDCGANIGASACYFLINCLGANVIAIEPEKSNFALCQRNLAAFGSRARCLQGAVWSSSDPVYVDDQVAAPGCEWAVIVHPEKGNRRSRVQTYTVEQLCAIYPNSRIDLLKMDIEGAELAIFKNAAPWLMRIRCIAIELHGAECQRQFFYALQNYKFTQHQNWEVTICHILE
jgi:FkbM family methyltransferase